VENGVHAGPIVISKPLTLIGENGAEIRGNGKGSVLTITADDVVVSGLRITNSGLQLSDDDAAVFVTGNRAKIDHNIIADSLHGVYLKKVSGAQILDNRIQGRTTLPVSSEPVEKTIGSSTENCDTTLVANRRGNGIHQWNCESNLIRGNEISEIAIRNEVPATRPARQLTRQAVPESRLNHGVRRRQPHVARELAVGLALPRRLARILGLTVVLLVGGNPQGFLRHAVLVGAVEDRLENLGDGLACRDAT
jgi:hypothetical protein